MFPPFDAIFVVYSYIYLHVSTNPYECIAIFPLGYCECML